MSPELEEGATHMHIGGKSFRSEGTATKNAGASVRGRGAQKGSLCGWNRVSQGRTPGQEVRAEARPPPGTSGTGQVPP